MRKSDEVILRILAKLKIPFIFLRTWLLMNN